MIYKNILENILGSKSKVRILEFLINNKGAYSANQISKKINMTPRTVLLALDDLIKAGVIMVDYKKKDKIYSIKENNWFVENILKFIFNGEKKFYENIKEKLIKILNPYSGDISSILIEHEKILIIFKDYVVPLRIEELKKIIETEEIIDKIIEEFSYKPDFVFYSIFSIPSELELEKFISIYGLTPEEIKANAVLKQERLKKAKDFFEF